ncbi:MAG: hypothetical protein HXY19_01630 [Thermoanaerobaculaceae bacterium]|nr:hypothetical protein [Thermoanaerobaculaceae bacterium]
MREAPRSAIEEVLLEARSLHFLTPQERGGGWRRYFGPVADRVPEPYPLFAEDERTSHGPAWPLLASPNWQRFTRELATLITAEVGYRVAVASGARPEKRGLVTQRGAAVQHLAELLENALLHDHNQRLPEILWLALSREMTEAATAALRSARLDTPKGSPAELAPIRYALAEAHIDLAFRAEAEAVGRLKRSADFEPPPRTLAFGRLLREDVLPFLLPAPTARLADLDPYLRIRLALDVSRFHTALATAVAWLDEMRQENLTFARALSLVAPEATQCPSWQLIFVPGVLDLLETFEGRAAQKLPADIRTAMESLGARLKRFEVVAALRECLLPVTVRGNTLLVETSGGSIRLSSSIRPLDFAAPGVVDSTVRRYGLLYDLVEFTQILEGLRRRGRSAEDEALRFMVRFQQRVQEIRQRHRLHFEKFLGDGAFFSARRPAAAFFAAAELRQLYETFRVQGFPFDRGLRLAVNVGTYHLLPMVAEGEGAPHFEFLGHGLVELARLTTGKTTQEVEDIADFLISAGYDVHRVLEFLEPVRHASRHPDHVRQRPYAAFLAENQELVNLGGVVTEAFLRELEAELAGQPLFEAEQWGLRWLLVPGPTEDGRSNYVGLRLLGTPRLKGLDPTPVAEMAVFEAMAEPPLPLPQGASLLDSLQRLAGRESGAAESGKPEALVDPRLCVASVLEAPDTRIWYIGLFHEEVDALFHAFRVPLSPVGVQDGEPFESWLFRQRFELAKLYRGLRRDGHGATLSLADLRSRDGYFACLLQAPHRSPR